MNELERAQQRLTKLYSGETFAESAAAWSEVLSAHLSSVASRDTQVLNWDAPEDNISLADSFLSAPAKQGECFQSSLRELLQVALDHGQNLHHPRYIGHQVPASIPIAALFDALGSVTNQVMAIYEMGPWATSVERAMIERLGGVIGFPAGDFAGLVTSGGSLANLTALLTARNVVLEDSWQQGIQDAQRLALVVQEDVHYCVARAAGILGIGSAQIVRVPVDARRKMRVDVLDSELGRLAGAGTQVIAVAAGACATPIGAFDPLEAVADVCRKHRVWMHVDAAHGGGALFSPRYRQLCAGLNAADSVVWDAHKMLFMPALCAFAFYKDRSHRFATFEQDAPYLFDPSSPGMAEYDSGIQTVECTKRAATYGLWGMWSLFGETLFRDLVEVTFGRARQLYEKLLEAEDFEPLHEPECNIQVFRYLPKTIRDWPDEEIGEYQLSVRRWLIQSGFAYIVPYKLDGVGALRATVMNPCTQEDDLDELLDAIRRYPGAPRST